jgi:hypothetical protein
MQRFFILPILVVLLSLSSSLAQEFDCDVSINTQQLSNEARDNLSDFAQQLKNYINNYKWTKEDFGQDKIKCTLEIHFQGSQGSNHFIAQLFIGSQRPIHKLNKNTAVLRLKDDNWEFDYVRSQPMQHENFQFDPLVSFIDYYCYLILGCDTDTWGSSEGTPYLEKAMEIVNKARSAGNAGQGWDVVAQNAYSRGQFVDELLNTKFQPFREAVYRYHYWGLDQLFRYPEKGKKTILAALEMIGNLQQKINQPSLIIRTFFETKYLEIADTFTGYTDMDVFQRLIVVDPSHKQAYEKARQGLR